MKSPTLYICAECANTVCESAGTNRTCVNCGAFVSNWITIKGLTNADRIRAMTDEELANLLARYNDWTEEADLHEVEIYKKWLDWLRQEVDNGRFD